MEDTGENLGYGPNHFIKSEGWECPRCKNILSPSMVSCPLCKPPKVEGIISTNQQMLTEG